MICRTCENLDCNGTGLYCMIVDCACSVALSKVSCPCYEPIKELSVTMKSVSWVLRSLNLMDCHVVIRKRGKYFGQTETLGGGSVGSVISRFGSMSVVSSDVIGNVLYLYVE